MAWNEPGKPGSDDKDPWSGRDKKQPPKGPPDLDEALKKFQQKLGGIFGKKPSGAATAPIKGGMIGIALLLIVVIAVWIIGGFFVVQPPERATILRFGKYIETVGPGLHWIPRFIDSEDKVNIQKISTYSYDATMLTKDENIISVAVTVFSRVDNPKAYLYNVVNPIESLRQATASALRQVVGLNTLDAILTIGREKVRDEVRQQLDQTLERYKSGLIITDVALQSAKAPEQVKAAFDDAIKAQEDEQRYINQAQAYKMRVVPIAKGQATRTLEAAKAYKQKVMLQAQGATAQYLAILPEYKKAPKVTRERLYLNSVEKVLSASSKVLVDVKGANNLLYLPLDKILDQQHIKLTPTKPQADNGTGAHESVSHTTVSKQTSTRPTREEMQSAYATNHSGEQY